MHRVEEMNMNIVERMSRGEKLSIGMVHTLPLPGTYRNTCGMEKIIERAVADAKTLERAGFDALIVENVNDGPFGEKGMSTQQIAAMAVITRKVREAVSIDVGIDACGDSIAGIEIANIVGGVSFVRIPAYVDVRISMTGIDIPNGGKAVLRRKEIGAEQVKLFADVQVKHTYPLCPEISIEQSTAWAVANFADAIIVTGVTTGAETPLETIRRVKAVTKLPVVVGSGTKLQNVAEQYRCCDGAIIGSSLKENGDLLNPVDYQKAAELIAAIRRSTQ